MAGKVRGTDRGFGARRGQIGTIFRGKSPGGHIQSQSVTGDTTGRARGARLIHVDDDERSRGHGDAVKSGVCILTPHDEVETVTGVYWVDLEARHPIASRIKRAIDIAYALVLLIVSAPVFIGTALFIRIAGRGPAIYVQRRIGFRCGEFDMYKFRTMIEGADLQESVLKPEGQAFLKIQSDRRITPWGRFLREYSIDELPQLVNVLQGTMSLVGPRPLLLSDLAHFPLRSQMRRFSVKPGITGLWQVSGRSATSEDERLDLDKEYVNEWSLWLDVKILLRTVKTVLSGRGAV